MQDMHLHDPAEKECNPASMVEENDILNVLRRVIDPEVGINVVDLGLVYDAKAIEGRIEVAMTMTTPACPMNSYLTEEAKRLLFSEIPGTSEVKIDLVWDPPWEPEMMSEAAKKRLGWE